MILSLYYLFLIFIMSIQNTMESADITESGHGQSRLRRQKMTTKDKLKNCIKFVKRNDFTIEEFFLKFIRSSEYSRENSHMCEVRWDHQILDK